MELRPNDCSPPKPGRTTPFPLRHLPLPQATCHSLSLPPHRSQGCLLLPLLQAHTAHSAESPLPLLLPASQHLKHLTHLPSPAWQAGSCLLLRRLGTSLVQTRTGCPLRRLGSARPPAMVNILRRRLPQGSHES